MKKNMWIIVVSTIFLLSTFRSKRAIKQKNYLQNAQKSMVDNSRERLQLPDICYLRQLRGFADTLKPTPIPEHWLKNIIEV